MRSEEQPKKHPCPDCSFCQWCGDDRCRLCRGTCATPRRKLSQAEQIALYDAINDVGTNMHADETLDELRGYGLRIAQPIHGYRFSLDPLLLCDFGLPRPGERVLDLGTGSGIIPLMLARRVADLELVGVEHQQAMAELARRNVAMNGLAERITIFHEDVTALTGHFPASSFDSVLANPPFRKQGTGRLSPKAGRDLARHESSAGLAEFLAAAKYLVKPGGRICFVHLPARLGEFLATAATLKLAPLRLRLVHGAATADARMFLIELAKGRRGELQVLPPLITRGNGGDYSAEISRMLTGV